MPQTSSKQLLTFFAKTPQSLQEEIMEAMIEKYHFLKSNHQSQNRSSLYLKALLSVLDSYQTKLQLGSAKKHSKELTSLKEKTDLRLKMMETASHKSAKKREKLLRVYAPLIVRLKEEENQSFSQIQRYLAKYHKQSIDHTYLCKLYPLILHETQSPHKTNTIYHNEKEGV